MSSHSRTNAVDLAIGLAGNSRGSSLSGGLRPNLGLIGAEPGAVDNCSIWATLLACE